MERNYKFPISPSHQSVELVKFQNFGEMSKLIWNSHVCRPLNRSVKKLKFGSFQTYFGNFMNYSFSVVHRVFIWNVEID